MLPPRLPYSGAHWVDHVARHAYTIPDAVALSSRATRSPGRNCTDEYGAWPPRSPAAG